MILVVDMNGKRDSLGLPEFVLSIIAAVKTLDDISMKHYSEIRRDHVDKCDCIILSGTALKDNATLNQLGRFEWLKTCDKPILGICAGMQTIALVFGSTLTTCLGIGMTEVMTTKENLLFQGTFQAYSLHNFSVSLSQDFDVLAQSPQCIEAVKHKRQSFYGVLFHPEVRNQEILQRFVTAFSPHRRV